MDVEGVAIQTRSGVPFVGVPFVMDTEVSAELETLVDPRGLDNLLPTGAWQVTPERRLFFALLAAFARF